MNLWRGLRFALGVGALMGALVTTGGRARAEEGDSVPPPDAYRLPPYAEIAAGRRPAFTEAPDALPLLGPGQVALFHADCAEHVAAVFAESAAVVPVVQPAVSTSFRTATAGGDIALAAAHRRLTGRSAGGALALTEEQAAVEVFAAAGGLASQQWSHGVSAARHRAGMASEGVRRATAILAGKGGDRAEAEEAGVAAARGAGGERAREARRGLGAALGAGAIGASTAAANLRGTRGGSGAASARSARSLSSTRKAGGGATAADRATLASLERLRGEFLQAAEAAWGRGSLTRFGALDSEAFRHLLAWYRDRGELPPVWLVDFLDLLEDEDFLAWEGFYDEEGRPIPLDETYFEEIRAEVADYERLDERADAGLIDYLLGPLSSPCAREAACADRPKPDVAVRLTIEPEGTPALYHGHGAVMRIAVTNRGPGRLCNFLLLAAIPEHTAYVPLDAGGGIGFHQRYLRGQKALRIKVFAPLDPGQSFRKQVVLRLEPWTAGSLAEVADARGGLIE